MGCGASAKKYTAQTDGDDDVIEGKVAKIPSNYGSENKTGFLARLRGEKSCDIIADNFHSYADVTDALRKTGLKKVQLMVGIDFTLSNSWNGRMSFGGHNLHDLVEGVPNPYMEALRNVTTALRDFDGEHQIRAYGFGDSRTKRQGIFSFEAGDEPSAGFPEVQQSYEEILNHVVLAGPTSFAPLIRHAVSIVRKTGEYTILVIIADGMVERPQETIDALIEASDYALSIIMIGVGDGVDDWDLMKMFDDEVYNRKFDNFQFIKFDCTFEQLQQGEEDEERAARFAMGALMEVPDQYAYIKKHGLLKRDRKLPRFEPPPAVLEPPPPLDDKLKLDPASRPKRVVRPGSKEKAASEPAKTLGEQSPTFRMLARGEQWNPWEMSGQKMPGQRRVSPKAAAQNNRRSRVGAANRRSQMGAADIADHQHDRSSGRTRTASVDLADLSISDAAKETAITWPSTRSGQDSGTANVPSPPPPPANACTSRSMMRSFAPDACFGEL